MSLCACLYALDHALSPVMEDERTGYTNPLPPSSSVYYMMKNCQGHMTPILCFCVCRVSCKDLYVQFFIEIKAHMKGVMCI